MSWLTQTLTSTLGRKLLMSLTGIFLITFLVVHVAGNMQLLKSDDGMAFNIYADFMTSNPLIKTASYLLYAGILLHVIVSIILTKQNRSARPVKYAYEKASGSSSWASRNMGILGTIIFVFLVIHMRSFWFEMKFGDMPKVKYEQVSQTEYETIRKADNPEAFAASTATAYRDLYLIVQEAFAQWWYALLYVVAMVFLGFHLGHGFASAFQTLGLNHKKYTPLIEKLGIAFSVIVPLLFASQPIYMFLFT